MRKMENLIHSICSSGGRLRSGSLDWGGLGWILEERLGVG